jgi:hypothetical protein
MCILQLVMSKPILTRVQPDVLQAKVAELVDALDLGSSGVTRESSSLSFRTNAEVEIMLSEGYLFGLKLA